MILHINDLKNVCGKLSTIVSKAGMQYLEIKTEKDNVLFIVGNTEMYVTCKIASSQVEDFHATVDASSFIELINKSNKESISITESANGNNIEVVSEGSFNISKVQSTGSMLTITPIEMSSVTSTFTMPSETIFSIQKFSSKEFESDKVSTIYTYFTDSKALTLWGSAACQVAYEKNPNIPLFTLTNNQIKIISIFGTEGDILFEIGEDKMKGRGQTDIRLSNDEVMLVAHLSCDTTREETFKKFLTRWDSLTLPREVELSKAKVLQTLSRLLIFDDKTVPLGLTFNKQMIDIEDPLHNKESITYETSNVVGFAGDDVYTATVTLQYLKNAVENFNTDTITLKFGNNKHLLLVADDYAVNIMERRLK